MDAFKIIGISVRTINKDGHSKRDIGNLWNRWFAEALSDTIPNKVNGKIINMYTNYDSDEHDYYTTILGHSVNSLGKVPNGMVGLEMPTSNYKEFISEGILPTCVLNTWEQIWNSEIDRKYSADFDVYNPSTMDQERALVKTYVSIN